MLELSGFVSGIPVWKESLSIREHCNSDTPEFKQENFKIIGTCNNSIDLRILETLHIHCKHPSLNSNSAASTLNIVQIS